MDLRIKKTYRALFDAFTELLEEYRFEDLTVAMLCDRIAHSIRERVMNVLAEDALAPVSLETTSEFVAGGIIRLFTIWWESGHDLERRPEIADVVDALFERTMTPVHH